MVNTPQQRFRDYLKIIKVQFQNQQKANSNENQF